MPIGRYWRPILRHAEANHLLGLVLHQTGQSEAAAELLATAVANAPANPTYHVNRGVVLKALGQLEAAVASYEAALRLDPNLAVAQANLGVALLGLGRVAEAIAAQRAALALKPNYPEAEINLGLALGAGGDAAAAIAAFERGARAAAGLFQRAYSPCQCAASPRRSLEAAEAAARAAVRLQPQNPAGHHALGRVLAAAGQYACGDIFGRRSALRPDRPGVRRSRAGAQRVPAISAARSPRSARRSSSGMPMPGCMPGSAGRRPNWVACRGRSTAIGGRSHSIRTISLPGGAGADPHRRRADGRGRNAIIATGSAREPEALTPRRASVFTSNYLDGPASETSRRAARIWPSPGAERPGAHPRTTMTGTRDRRLRVGLVSGDFDFHPVAISLPACSRRVDAGAIDLFAYANSLKRDAMTERLSAAGAELARGGAARRCGARRADRWRWHRYSRRSCRLFGRFAARVASRASRRR